MFQTILRTHFDSNPTGTIVNMYQRISTAIIGQIRASKNNYAAIAQQAELKYSATTRQIADHSRHLQYKEIRTQFESKTGWYQTMLRSYERIINEIAVSEKDYQWNMFDTKVRFYLPSNVDYFIEVNNNTKLGLGGSLGNVKNIVHFEIFSDNNLIDNSELNSAWTNMQNPKFVLFPETNKTNYFVVFEKLRLLRNKGFFNNADFFKEIDRNFALNGEVVNYYGKNTNNPERFIITQHLHSYYTLSRNELSTMLDSTHITREIRQEIIEEREYFNWFSRNSLSLLKPLTRTLLNSSKGIFATFYHPISFLAWLDKKYIQSRQVP
jgi:hypothetical protein